MRRKTEGAAVRVTFEEQYGQYRDMIARYARSHIRSREDAEDVLQEIALRAAKAYPTLRDEKCFPAWLMRIARGCVTEYYRSQARRKEESRPEIQASGGGNARRVADSVRETMASMQERDRRLLSMAYAEEYPLAEIARALDIPKGTVKSRLYAARERFRRAYPYPPKEETNMSRLPDRMPEYRIEKLPGEPFPVVWEELMGWFLVPKQGEALFWAMYDFPERRITDCVDIRAGGPAVVHGLRGVEVTANEWSADAPDRATERRFVAQLEDDRCRILAESHVENGVRLYHTFLDGGAFLCNWGFGENNAGNETRIAPKGLIRRKGAEVTCEKSAEVLDVTGLYRVTIGGKVFDTVCVMDIELYNEAVASEQYLDREGHTVLWRRFNRDSWQADTRGGLWSERLPDNERITINGETYVHWYDCITDRYGF